MSEPPADPDSVHARAPQWLPVGSGTQLDDDPDAATWTTTWAAPSGAPGPRRRLRTVWVGAVMVLATMLLAGTAAYAYRDAVRLEDTYLPADGAYSAVDLTAPDGTTSDAQLEQAVFPGGNSGALGMLGIAATQNLPPGWAGQHSYWVMDITGEHRRLRLLLVVGAQDVVFQGLSGQQSATVVTPPLPITGPTAPTAPTQEASTVPTRLVAPDGTLSGASVSLTANTEGGCLEWKAVLTGASPHGDALTDTIELQLCRGEGLRSLTYAHAGQQPLRMVTTSTRPPARTFTGSLDSGTIPDPATLAGRRPVQLPMVIDRAAGTELYQPYVTRPPVATAGGLVVFATADHSVAAVRPGTKRAPLVWAAHPGGVVMHVVTAGDLILVSTSQRLLVAYDRRGVRVWQIRLPDVAGDLVVQGERLYVAVQSGPVLALDARTGHALWRSHAAAQGRPDAQLAASPDYVAVLDQEGVMHVLTTDTAAEVLSGGGGPPQGMAFVDELLVTLRGGRLQVRPVGQLFTVDVHTHTGSSSGLVTAGTTACSAGPVRVTCVDVHTGEVVEQFPGVDSTVVGSGAVALISEQGVRLLTAGDPHGTTLPMAVDSGGLALAGWGVVAVGNSDSRLEVWR